MCCSWCLKTGEITCHGPARTQATHDYQRRCIRCCKVRKEEIGTGSICLWLCIYAESLSRSDGVCVWGVCLTSPLRRLLPKIRKRCTRLPAHFWLDPACTLSVPSFYSPGPRLKSPRILSTSPTLVVFFIYIHIHMYVYTHIYTYMYIYICVYVYIYVYICEYIYMYIYKFIYIFVYLYIYIHICMFIYIYIYKDIYVYVYIHINIYIYM